jgi:hypothetical protein
MCSGGGIYGRQTRVNDTNQWFSGADITVSGADITVSGDVFVCGGDGMDGEPPPLTSFSKAGKGEEHCTSNICGRCWGDRSAHPHRHHFLKHGQSIPVGQISTSTINNGPTNSIRFSISIRTPSVVRQNP